MLEDTLVLFIHNAVLLGLDSRIIKLNQKPLVATAAALLPKLVGRRTTAPTLLIPPLTITFVAVKGVTQCHARQY